ncbi:hypothetical protein RFI_08786 [Reticulomyxa filosa]|uniref:Uncharacterized protein n=1 Tax=Reticulomyxa filosa TaxID=46433 RepID=X6NRJ3_RETFI|nr:hypothetical protein RFI_08786 [Reticulomyxa filosa]|eukprot:ETO28344.1 hypothetical protein RFI_08786 [Reticulomyxa filosa]
MKQQMIVDGLVVIICAVLIIAKIQITYKISSVHDVIYVREETVLHLLFLTLAFASYFVLSFMADLNVLVKTKWINWLRVIIPALFLYGNIFVGTYWVMKHQYKMQKLKIVHSSIRIKLDSHISSKPVFSESAKNQLSVLSPRSHMAISPTIHITTPVTINTDANTNTNANANANANANVNTNININTNTNTNGNVGGNMTMHTITSNIAMIPLDSLHDPARLNKMLDSSTSGDPTSSPLTLVTAKDKISEFEMKHNDADDTASDESSINQEMNPEITSGDKTTHINVDATMHASEAEVVSLQSLAAAMHSQNRQLDHSDVPMDSQNRLNKLQLGENFKKIVNDLKPEKFSFRQHEVDVTQQYQLRDIIKDRNGFEVFMDFLVKF